ncbi:MAG: sugar ABC transporter substrate-binding protein, partial [Planctomycetota bacterium]
MSGRRWLIVCTVSALGVMLVGCGKDGDQQARKRQIGFLMTLDHPYWQNMRLGAEDEAEKLGVEVTILNAKEDPVLQIEQIKEPLVRGVQMLNRAKIPVIIVNREIGEGCEYVCYTGTD